MYSFLQIVKTGLNPSNFIACCPSQTTPESIKLSDSDSFSLLPQITQTSLMQTGQLPKKLISQAAEHQQNQFQAQISQMRNQYQLLELFIQHRNTGVLQQVHTLNFSGAGVSPELLVFVAENCPNLQKLLLPINNLASFDRLSQLSQLTSLVIFADSDTKEVIATASSMQLFVDSIASFKNLEHLEIKLNHSFKISDTKIGTHTTDKARSEHCLDFESWNCLKNIKSLIISVCFSFKFPYQLLNEALLYLEIHSSFLQNNHLTHIGKAINLESLDLSECRSITKIEPNWPFEKLKLINFKNTQVILPALYYRNLCVLVCGETNLSIDPSEQRTEAPKLKVLNVTIEQSVIEFVDNDDEPILTATFNSDFKIICPTEDVKLPNLFCDLMNSDNTGNVSLLDSLSY